MLFVGFGDRLLAEIKRETPKDVKIRVGFTFFAIYISILLSESHF